MSLKSERKKINRQRKKLNKGRMINKDILRLSVFFCILFGALMVYIAVFLAFDASAVINNSYNKRAESFKRTVKRGEIYDAAGNVLAYSELDENGNETRIYPYGNTFAHVVGFDAYGGLGLEASYKFYMLTAHNNMFEKISNEFSGIKNPGDAIHTTLDTGLQTYISDLLGSTKGAVIAVNPANGHIYANVSKPDFNPNTIMEDWDSITSDEEASPLLNRATQGKYTPGSTFKIFTLQEYMRENPNYADFHYNCSGSISGDGFTIRCNEEAAHGEENLQQAFAYSCNCAFADIALKLDRKLFMENNTKLLFNSPLNVDIAYNEASYVLGPSDSDFMAMQTAFGQGQTSTNPLHLGMVMSAYANQGVLMRQHFVTHITNQSGNTIKTFPDSQDKVLVTEAEAAAMNEYLRAVVTEGTANTLAWRNYTAYGKTGTAETSSNRDENYDRSWFVGYAELNGEKLVLSIIIDNMNEAPMKAVDYAAYIFDYYFN